MKTTCIHCGAVLKWGGFRIEQYPSWLWDKRDLHTDILNWFLAVTAELYRLDKFKKEGN